MQIGRLVTVPGTVSVLAEEAQVSRFRETSGHFHRSSVAEFFL